MIELNRGEPREIGWPTWIRTMNNASKGHCVTITPSAKPAVKLAVLSALCKVKMAGQRLHFRFLTTLTGEDDEENEHETGSQSCLKRRLPMTFIAARIL